MRIEYKRKKVVRYKTEMLKMSCGKQHLDIYEEPVPCNCYRNARIKIPSYEWVPVYIREPGDDTPLETISLDDMVFRF